MPAQLAAAEFDDLRLQLFPRLLPFAHAASLTQPRSLLLLFGSWCGSVSHNESTALERIRRRPTERMKQMSTRYEEPNRVAQIANKAIRWLAEMGISIAGT